MDSSKTVVTHQVTIWMAVDVATAHRVIREHCYAEGACFTVTPSKFIYTGGEEDGFAVGLVNYPRFPSQVVELHERARALAAKLLPACNQRSCLLVGTSETEWIVVEPRGAPGSSKARATRRHCSCQCACTGIEIEDECPHRQSNAVDLRDGLP